MKVYQDDFKPVVIKLDTKEELQFLWDLVSLNKDEIEELFREQSLSSYSDDVANTFFDTLSSFMRNLEDQGDT